MTLGEIKAEALRLMHIDMDVDAETVGNIEFDDNFGVLYSGIVGAVNRALSDLEARRILPLKRALLGEAYSRRPQNGASRTSQNGASRTSPPTVEVCEAVAGQVVYFPLDGIADLSLPARLTVIGEGYVVEDCPYTFEAGRLRVMDYDKGAAYELLYHPRPARVKRDTPNGTVLEIPEVLVAALPYYVKADVFRIDEPGEANDARNWYENAVAQYASLLHNGPQGSVINAFEGVF